MEPQVRLPHNHDKVKSGNFENSIRIISFASENSRRFVFSCYLDSAGCVTLKAEFETMDGKNQDVDSEAFKETYCDHRGSLIHT